MRHRPNTPDGSRRRTHRLSTASISSQQNRYVLGYPDTPSLLALTRSRNRSRSPLPGNRTNSFPLEDDPCDDCGLPVPGIALCHQCDRIFCPRCWDRQVAHRRNRRSGRVVLHEKTDIVLARKVRNALEPSSNEQILTTLHEEDAQTAWFGEIPVPIALNDAILIVPRNREATRRQSPYLQRFWPI